MRKRGKFEKVPAPAPAPSRYEKLKKKTLLQSYLISLASLVLCGTMLMGTTVAWFTTEVTSHENQIHAGTLDVDVLYNGQSIENVKIFDPEIKWVPNKLVVRTLTVKDNGEIPFKYNLTLPVLDTKDMDQNTVTDAAVLAGLRSQFTVYVKDGKVESATPADLTEENGWKYVGTLNDIFNGGINLFAGYSSKMTDKQATYSIAVHMDDEAKIEWQGYALNFNVALIATQIGAPETVKNQNEFADALSAGKQVTVNLTANQNYKMSSVNNASVTITGTTDATLELPFKQVTGNGSTVLIEGVTVKGVPTGNFYSELFNGATKVVYRNCTIVDQLSTYCDTEFIDCRFVNTFDNDYSVYCYSGKNITFEGCTFENKCTKAIKVYDEGNGGRNVYVKDCTFKTTATDAKKAPVEIDSTYSTYHVYFSGNNVMEGAAYIQKGVLWNSDVGEDQGTNVYIDGVKQ